MRVDFIPLLLLLPAILGSSTPEPTEESPYVVGPDDPADPATASYFVNKVGISVSDLNRSLDFYNQVFGFRHMFTTRITSHLSIAYLGKSSGGKNGTAYQTTEEMIRNKNNAEGQLELIHLNATGNGNIAPAPLQRTSTFRHILGFIVPNTTETQARLEKYGLEIYKKVGEDMPTTGPLGDRFAYGDATGLSDKAWEEIQKAMTKVNFWNVLAVDPDGNLFTVFLAEENNPSGA
ncbi:hypothetical protein FDECE_11378 [Fusarium decemcellulare]|nr:hypothetical protein FDECE_11378 [Fusarium decemcellulare]